MALVETRNFRAFKVQLEEDKRPESPTIMVTKSSLPQKILQGITLMLAETYKSCNANFFFNPSENPARPLTKPSEPKYNDSYDNEYYHYILYVNEKLISPDGEHYIVLDTLGEGTFGQVVKCKSTKGLIYAAKVIKNKPVYYMQGLIEVKILSKLNKELDPNDTNHIVRMVDYFVFRNHLIIIFELLSLNIYELIKKNGMRGFSLSLIRSFTKQMLEALCIMEKGNIIHCDMKPENVLLASDRGIIKVIDFGSACFEDATIYTYIQSRYYRSPEVLIGLPYGSEIDSWSLACICAELYIGIPLFPGSNEHEQLFRIIQWIESPPQSMIIDGKFRDKFFAFDGERYRLKTFDEYSRSQNVPISPYRAYLDITNIDDLVNLDRKIPREDPEERKCFIDLLKGLLKMSPADRWTASQAINHPFVQGQPLTSPFIPEPKIHKSRSAPAGTLTGSCPSLLQRISGSQDMTIKPGDVCFRPLVEELKDEFFTGFAHGKLMQIKQAPQPPPVQINWTNPFSNNPIDYQPRYSNKNQFRPMPDIIGPRYYSCENHGQFPRPFSPSIEKSKYKNNTKNKNIKKNTNYHKGKSHNTKFDDITPKVVEQIRPNSIDEKKIIPPDKLLNQPLKDFKTIIDKKVCNVRAVDPDPSGFLNKIKKEASQQK
ncbi:hypothetical protein SteCoe_3395 [Stentor coeruleus]|uniref:Protein kinase domain-containing protein n=1 Tax=Stentor coeruleus TaxID=5963 RepID=A0A1R2CX38_9CILI|nr:hypothetical protein SteCoe_3395 [Stentor coeruleus]